MKEELGKTLDTISSMEIDHIVVECHSSNGEICTIMVDHSQPFTIDLIQKSLERWTRKQYREQIETEKCES
jgi:hypothetical protein